VHAADAQRVAKQVLVLSQDGLLVHRLAVAGATQGARVVDEATLGDGPVAAIYVDFLPHTSSSRQAAMEAVLARYEAVPAVLSFGQGPPTGSMLGRLCCVLARTHSAQTILRVLLSATAERT